MGRSFSADEEYYDIMAVDAKRSARAAFLKNTYAHLGAAVLAFMLITSTIMSMPSLKMSILEIFGTNPFVILIAFVVTTFIANRMAYSESSVSTQYAGLAIYTIAESIIFIPLLTISLFPNISSARKG